MHKIIFNFFLIFIFVGILGSAKSSYASCALLNGPPTTNYKILKTWNASHASDEHFKGCLAQIHSNTDDELMITYVPYNFICASHDDTEFELDILQACCDTGRFGDYACGVIPDRKWKGGLDKDFQTNLTAVPTSQGNETFIIEELMDRLEKGAFQGSGGMVQRVINISTKRGGNKFIEPYKKRLKRMLRSEDSNTAYNAAQILEVFVKDDALKAIIYKKYLEQGFSLNKERTLRALEYFQNHPDYMDQEILNEIISFNQFDDNDSARKVALEIIGHLDKEDLEPLLGQLYKKLFENGGGDEKKLWTSMVCKVFKKDNIEFMEVNFQLSYSKGQYVQCAY